MRVPTLHTAQRAFEGVESRQARQAQLQDQLGTGLRISKPGDDPLGAAQAELARSRLARLGQDQRAASLAGALLSTAEGALGQGVSLLQSARESLVAAGNGSYSATERQALALQLRGVRQQMLDLANSDDGTGGRVFSGQGSLSDPFTGLAPQPDAPSGTQRIGEGGRYAATLDGRAAFINLPRGNGLFTTASAAGNTGTGWIDSGSVTDATQLTGQAYAIEISGTPGNLLYTVRNTTTEAAPAAPAPLPADGVLVIDGARVKIGGTPVDGDRFELGPSARQSVFRTLDDAIALLESPSLRPGQYAEQLERAQASLDRALESLSLLRGQVGAELQRVDQANAANEQQTLDVQVRRSQLQDLDFAKAISELHNNQTGLEAALRSYASVGKTSLFQLL